MPRIVSTTPGERVSPRAARAYAAMRWSLLLLCTAGVSACSQTVLVHSDGRPFHVREPIQTFDGGWIAVDSCASGYHALLEIETEAEPSFPLMPFLLASGLLGVLQDVSVTGPLCWDEGASRRPYRGSSRPFFNLSEAERCVYLLRAEYTLTNPPPSNAAWHLADLLRR